MSVRFGNRYLRCLAAVVLANINIPGLVKGTPLWNFQEYISSPWFIQCPVTRNEKWPCQPYNSCITLPATGSKTDYCGWDGENLLVCCPSGAIQKYTSHSKCGYLGSEVPRHYMFSAIVGGVSVRNSTAYPWMVAVGEYTENGLIEWYCGGSLIHNDKILTAAHCVVRRKADIVRVGELDFSVNSNKALPADIRVKSVSVHPSYSHRTHYHDIAIIHLVHGVSFNKHVRPVCLPDDDEPTYEGDIAVVTGWGYTSFDGEKSSVLKEVSVEVISNKDCNTSYSNISVAKRRFPQGIINKQLCAGNKNGGKDACQGDSGGPLVLRKENVYTQIGIVSLGFGCGSRLFPGVYTKVSSYVNWIKDQLH